MKIFLLSSIFILLGGCAPLAIKKARYEDCIVKMREADVPPLKALKICEKIHDKDNKDLKTEEELAKEI